MSTRAGLGTGFARGAEQAARDPHVCDGGAGRARGSPRSHRSFAAILPRAEPVAETARALLRGSAKVVDLDATVFP
jgi:hypothetical protein